MDDATGEGHYMCGKCYDAEVTVRPSSFRSPFSTTLTLLLLSQPERVGDICAVCNIVDPLEWRRSKIKKREGEPHVPAPLCKSCYMKEHRALKKKD